MTMTSCHSCESCWRGSVTTYDHDDHDQELEPFGKYRESGQPCLHPPPLELIQMICIEYQLERTDTCLGKLLLRSPDTEEFKALKNGCVRLIETGWILLETYSQAQRGATFYNVKSSQLVIVHRGTQSLDSAKADVREVVAQMAGLFTQTAYAYLRRVVQKYGAAARSITATGHSLGGFSSCLATWFMQYPEEAELAGLANEAPRVVRVVRGVTPSSVKANPHINSMHLPMLDVESSTHLHCVSFDGPGVKETITKLCPKYEHDRLRVTQMLEALDVTVYLCTRNSVNVINEQIGSIFFMPGLQADANAKAEDRAALSKFVDSVVDELAEQLKDKLTLGLRKTIGPMLKFKSHSSDRILKFWVEAERVPSVQVMRVIDAPAPQSFFEYRKEMLSPEGAHVTLTPFNPFEFRASVFSPQDRLTLRALSLQASFYAHSRLWLQDYSAECVAALTKGFNMSHSAQLITLEPNIPVVGHGDTGRFVDHFVQNLRVQARRARKLNLATKTETATYVESQYIARTDEYVSSLATPKEMTPPNRFEWLTTVEGALRRRTNASSCIVEVLTPLGATHLCASVLYHFLKGGRPPKGSPQGCLFLPSCVVERKGYFVLSTTELGLLEQVHILISQPGSEFLPNLEVAVIECPSLHVHDKTILEAWKGRLHWRGREQAGFSTKVIVIREAMKGETPNVTTSELDALYGGLDVLGLARLKVPFKLPRKKVSLQDLIPPSSEFYKCPELNPGKLLEMLRTEVLGSKLTQLGQFEEHYFQQRTFQDHLVVDYSVHEVFILLVSRGHEDHEQRSAYINEFIAKKHPNLRNTNTKNVLCQGFASFDAAVHKFILVDTQLGPENYERVMVMGLKGHVLELQCQLGADGSRKYGLVWRDSFGQPDLSKLKVRKFGVQTDVPFLISRTTNRGRQVALTALADDAGMGKTTLMQSLAILHQNSRSTPVWTLFLELGKCERDLEKWYGSDSMTMDAVVAVLAMNEAPSHSETMTLLLLHLIRDQPERVAIFLDGLDEVDDELVPYVLRAVEILVKASVCVFISFRKRLIRSVCDKFRILPCRLDPLDKGQAVDFLFKYWTHHDKIRFDHDRAAVGDEMLKLYATKFLDNFKMHIGVEADKLVGFPFQLRLLAVGHLAEFGHFLTECKDSAGKTLMAGDESAKALVERHLPEFTGITDLYTKFIKAHIDEGLREKLIFSRAQARQTLNHHIIAGFDKLFCSTQRIAFASDLYAHKLVDVDKRALYAARIITNYVHTSQCGHTDEISVMHQSLAEFLAATLIFEELKSIKLGHRAMTRQFQGFLNSFLLLPRYENVQEFLHRLVLSWDQTPGIFRKVSDLRPNLDDILEELNCGQLVTDCCGRNLLHHIIMSANFDVMTCGECKRRVHNGFLLKAAHFFEHRDVFDATPFAYIFSSSACREFLTDDDEPLEIMQNLFLNCNVRREMGEMSNESSRTNLANELYRDELLSVGLVSLEPYLWGPRRNWRISPDICTCKNIDKNFLSEMNDFVVSHEWRLTDYSIELRRNSDRCFNYGSNNFDARLSSVFSSIGWALDFHQVGGGRIVSRINLVVSIWQRFEKGSPQLEQLEEELFTGLTNNNYQNYERNIPYLDVYSESHLLKLMLEKNKVDDGRLPTMKEDIWEVWRHSDFRPIKRGLGREASYHIFAFVEAFYTLTSGVDLQGSPGLKEFVRNWFEKKLEHEMSSYVAVEGREIPREERVKASFVQYFTVLVRVLSPDEREALVSESDYKSRVLQILEELESVVKSLGRNDGRIAAHHFLLSLRTTAWGSHLIDENYSETIGEILVNVVDRPDLTDEPTVLPKQPKRMKLGAGYTSLFEMRKSNDTE